MMCGDLVSCVHIIVMVMWSGPGDGGGIERLLECLVMDGGTGWPGPGDTLHRGHFVYPYSECCATAFVSIQKLESLIKF